MGVVEKPHAYNWLDHTPFGRQEDWEDSPEGWPQLRHHDKYGEPSRAHRDEVNARVIQDPHIAEMMDPSAMPFDSKRMAYGGFQTFVEL